MASTTALRAVLALCAIATFTQAQSVKLPAKVEAAERDLVPVVIEWDGDDLKFLVSPGLRAFREYDADPRIYRLQVFTKGKGEFCIIAVAAKGGKLSEFAICRVLVGGDPGPGPSPPDPPTPPPGPDDAISKALKAAWSVEPAAEKTQYRQKLADVWRAGSKVDWDDKLNPVQTVGDLYSVLKQASLAILPENVLLPTRQAIGKQVTAVVGTDPSVRLTSTHKSNFKELAARVAEVLEGLR